jgi:transcriptional regulator with XRE-family HTH domain
MELATTTLSSTALMVRPMPSPKGKSLSPEQNARVREAARKLLDKHDSATALAKTLGVTQAAVSSLLTERTGAGFQMAGAIARQLGITLTELIDGTDALPDPPASSAPVFGNLRGYDAAERAARARPGAALYEEQDWAAPRGWSGVLAMHEVTPDFVITLVAAAREARLHPGPSAEDKKLDAQLKGLATKDDRRLAKRKAADDSNAPLVLKPTPTPKRRAKRAAKRSRRRRNGAGRRRRDRRHAVSGRGA